MTTTERGGGLAGEAITLEERFFGLYKGSAGITGYEHIPIRWRTGCWDVQ